MLEQPPGVREFGTLVNVAASDSLPEGSGGGEPNQVLDCHSERPVFGVQNSLCGCVDANRSLSDRAGPSSRRDSPGARGTDCATSMVSA